jgi:hypothetical protein
MFFRLNPIRLRYIGGVGRMGWLEADELAHASLSLPQEADWLAEARVPDGIRLLGMDAMVWITAWQRRWTSAPALAGWPEAGG